MRRQRSVIFSVLMLVLASVASGQAQVCPGPTTGYIPTDYEEVTVGAAAVGLTPAKIPTNPVNTLGMAYVSVEGNAISYLFTGTPTATVGHQASAGASFYVCGQASLRAFKAIRVSADAKLKISYFRSE